MTSDVQNQLEAFHRFIGEQLNNGGTSLSPEECLDLWRTEHSDPQQLEESVAAVKRALDQADRGEALPLEEFDREFRTKHGIGHDA